ncbi:MAG: peptidase [Chloroflexi bacterium]|nr:MAG: peptidase [Chloroflexota bacterium]
MPTPQVAPYGSWQSPLSAADIYADSIRLRDLRLDGDTLYWVEARPDGRSVLVRRTPGGTAEDLTPPGFSVRTRVHEYGGAAYVVDQGVVYFANFADQRLYRQRPGQPPELLAPQEGLRYADGLVDRARSRLIVVREEHITPAAQPVNTLAAVDLADGARQQVLAQGYDFYASPRLSLDGTRLAWLAWNHPNMPWDGCELWVADVQPDGTLAGHALVAGGTDESIFQPEWAADGTLYFVSDRTGWWNLYRLRGDGSAEPLHPLDAEFGQPQWSFGQATYALESPGRLLCSYEQAGVTRLASLDTRSLAWTPLDLPYAELSGLRAAPGRLYFVGGSPTAVPALVALDLESGATEVIRRSRAETLDPAFVSAAQPIVFPTRLPDGTESTAYAYFYAPHNPAYVAPEGERPPLVLMSHGGPTSATSTALSYAIQFWTTRGFAVLDVDYGGSTGYGRAYRQRLNRQWGVVDVADCINAATYAVDQGWVDPRRLAIRGGSAGGFTTLAALTFYDLFTAGASYFGISDLEAMVRDTHKFESRYLDGLVGVYPDERAVYLQRSPIYAVDRLACPLLVLQGLDDPIVPPNQAEMMVGAVRARGLPVAYVPFTGEQHGFVKAENNRRALEAELTFYGRVFGFEPAGELEPLAIENL